METNNQNEKFPGFPPEPKTNFWRCPNIINEYTHILNGSEHKVLFYILRHTWGFNKTADEISLSQLVKGIKKFDAGTGLTKPTVIEAIKGLIKKDFIKKSKGRKANSYELVKNFNSPSKEFLPFGSNKNLHTIDKIAINNKQYGSSFNKKPYYDGMPMIKKNGRWFVIRGHNDFCEFGTDESKIEWKPIYSNHKYENKNTIQEG